MGYKYVFVEGRSTLFGKLFHNRCWRRLTPSSEEVAWDVLEHDTADAVVHKLLNLCFPFSFVFLIFIIFSRCVYISAEYIPFLHYFIIHFDRVRRSFGRGNKTARL